jgi:hypothetical protein
VDSSATRRNVREVGTDSGHIEDHGDVTGTLKKLPGIGGLPVK